LPSEEEEVEERDFEKLRKTLFAGFLWTFKLDPGRYPGLFRPRGRRRRSPGGSCFAHAPFRSRSFDPGKSPLSEIQLNK